MQERLGRMNHPDDKGLRAIAHAMLAFIGMTLLAVGLALISGIAQTGGPSAATPLAMVRHLPPQPEPADPSRRYSDAADEITNRPPRAADPPIQTGRPQPPKRHPKLARLAIVIDDIGHRASATRRFVAMGEPITYSILPGVPATRESARMIRNAGQEYIIHLPMQPFDYPSQDPGPHPLLLQMGLEETAQRVRGYFDLLPDAIGASNHMGSAYTWDAERMQVVQTVLAERNLFFLNSRTSDTPIPKEVAQRWGYRYLERDIFLDHDPAEAAVERAFQQAVRRAQRNGVAIAIGHPYPQTRRVLMRNLPRLESQGVKVVPLSYLLQERMGYMR